MATDSRSTPATTWAMLAALLAAAVGGAAGMTVTMKEADRLPEELRPIVPGGSWFDDMAMARLHEKHEHLRQQGRLDSHEHTDDSEEVFMLAKLRGIDMPTETDVLPVHIDSDENLSHGTLKSASSAHHKHPHSHEDNDDDDDNDDLDDGDDHEVHDDHHNNHDAFHRFLKDSPIHLRKVMADHGHDDDDDDNDQSHEHDFRSHEGGEMKLSTREFLEVYEKELESFFDRFMKATLQAEIGGVRIESTATGESDENQAIPLSSLRRRLPNSPGGPHGGGR